MPIEIKVGPPTITISQGRTFMVTTQTGEIEKNTEQGLYAFDTRFLSFYGLSINQQPLKLLNSSQMTFYTARFHLSNPSIETDDEPIEEDGLHLMINREVHEGLHEDLDIVNYTGTSVRFILELSLMSDFADLFEVRRQQQPVEGRRSQVIERGQEQTQWNAQDRYLSTTYDHEKFHLAFRYCVLSDVPVSYANGRLNFVIALAPQQSWHACCEMLLEHGSHVKTPVSGFCHRAHKATHVPSGEYTRRRAHADDFEQRQKRWREQCTAITTPVTMRPRDRFPANLSRMYEQAVADMGALRIYEMDVSDEAWVPAAGVPWFVTLFGRDSLTTAYQNMAVAPGFARGALKQLASYQAQEYDDRREAQPGKIMHELRVGELAYRHEIPFTPIYTTADATILYLIVLSEAYRWTGDIGLLNECRGVVEHCLQWIDREGDVDDDGFQEYKSHMPETDVKWHKAFNYENVGWKDAGDAVVDARGRQVKQPKALCELQGYVYDAKTRMAEVFAALGDEARARTLRHQANLLKQCFNEKFWMEEEGCYAYGLDPDKKQITSIASNAGHCLWSGIAERDKARRTAQRLLQEDMWSGWGIRTLSSDNPAYNPLVYQRGSIWPQDNGIIAEGFKRYGMVDEANRVIRGIFDAIERFDAYRPPELFAGIQRDGEDDFPVLYPNANIPQAWATGSIFHMLRTMLGLRADAPNKCLHVYPTLPDWLPDITLHGLRVGPCTMTLHFRRDGENHHSHCDIKEMHADPGTAPQDMIHIRDERAKVAVSLPS